METINDIIDAYPKEFIAGIRSLKGSLNPYHQTMHFELTVEDAKHIAWREGNKLSKRDPNASEVDI